MIFKKLLNSCSIGGGIALALGTASISQASTFNASADFSPTHNPNGVWHYGYSSNLNDPLTGDSTPLTLYADRFNVSGVDLLIDNNNVNFLAPNVSNNSTASVVTVGLVESYPGQLGFHPGRELEYSFVRWISPNSGLYNLITIFSGVDNVIGTSTDVYVLHNGTSLFSTFVNGFSVSSIENFSTTLSVIQGDRIDFAVGVGSDGDYGYDTTGLIAILSDDAVSTPEPANLVGIGVIAVLGILRRKAK